MERPGNRLDRKFADPKNLRFPIGDNEQVRQSWNEVQTPEARKKYTAADHRAVMTAIEHAWNARIGGFPPAPKRFAPDRPAHVAANFAGKGTAIGCDDDTAAR